MTQSRPSSSVIQINFARQLLSLVIKNSSLCEISFETEDDDEKEDEDEISKVSSIVTFRIGSLILLFLTSMTCMQ